MYDPEEALRREASQTEIQVMLEGIENRCGIDHPWTQRVQLMVDIFEILDQKYDDLDNCFDENEEKLIELKIDELIEIARQVLD